MLDTEYFPSNCLGREKKKKKEDLVKKSQSHLKMHLFLPPLVKALWVSI